MDKQPESSQFPRMDPNTPCLVLAPHLVYPTRSGSNIAIHNRWSAFSRFVPYVDIIGQRTVNRYESGELARTVNYSNAVRSQKRAALRTIVRRTQYQLEKFVTKEFCTKAVEHLADPAYGCIVGSYLNTVPLLAHDPRTDTRPHLVETHNDDFKWYRTLQESAPNPLARLAARLSERWTASIFRAHQHQLLLSHVTETDRQGYLRVAPDHRSIITPIGVRIPDTPPVPQAPDGDIRLLFVGSLGVIMNADALEYFGKRYFPILKQHFGDALHVDVVGNSPALRIESMCEEHGWGLHPNAPDELLHELLRKASFTLLPFEYATGAKLKLLESIAHGVPFLATSHVLAQLESIPPSCLLADDPADWLAHVEAIQKKGQSVGERTKLVDIAKRHSWEASARGVFERLTKA